MSTYEKLDVEALLNTLSLPDKVKLLAGKDFWHFEDVPSAGIPSVRCSDGPNGVRGQNFFNGTPASCFPSSTGLGSSWDIELAERVGKALGDECHAKGAHVLLGPTANMQRSPLGGRGFESWGEDPVLSGLISSAYIKGVQSKGVAACLKHYVANDQEFERFSNDSVVSQRALREIYLEPFRLAMKHAEPWSVMSSYNRVNGTHASESDFLLDDVLRKEWGFKGLIMSDWTGVYSTKESVEAGLDVEMPGPTTMRGAALLRQLGAAKVSEDTIDTRVRIVLELVNRAIASGIPFGAPEKAIDTPAMRSLLRDAATSAIVLLKNSESVLPLSKESKVSSIAVIGVNAKIAVPSGGGSASLAATYTVSPLEGITTAAKEMGATVEYASGVSAFRYLPLLNPMMKDAKIEVFAKNPVKEWYWDQGDKYQLSEADFEVPTKSSSCFMIDNVPWAKMGDNPLTRFTATITPDTTCTWEFSLASVGGSVLYVNNKLVVDNYNKYEPGELFFNMGSKDIRGTIDLEAGKTYPVEVRVSQEKIAAGATPFGAATGIVLGAYPKITAEKQREDAVALAKKSDLAVLVVGTNPDWESEGYDRKTIILPGETDALVSAVLAVNPKTIVVTQSGTPVAMPWIKDASTVVQAFFGGNELGNGLADVLFGKTNPSGKLPLSFPKRLEDNPAFNNFGITSETPGKSVYGEGVFMGYRHYQKLGIEPLFSFGYGLSYTTFEFSSLSVSSASADGKFTVSVSIKNTGKVAGSEVAQVYITPSPTSSTTSPVQQLKAFKKVSLKAGSSTSVKFDLEKEAFSWYNEVKKAWMVEKGTYGVLVGAGSEDIKLKGEVKVEKAFTWVGL